MLVVSQGAMIYIYDIMTRTKLGQCQHLNVFDAIIKKSMLSQNNVIARFIRPYVQPAWSNYGLSLDNHSAVDLPRNKSTTNPMTNIGSTCVLRNLFCEQKDQNTNLAAI